MITEANFNITTNSIIQSLSEQLMIIQLLNKVPASTNSKFHRRVHKPGHSTTTSAT
jgi:hypothetical protein